MDERRLSTGDVLDAGIISQPIPQTEIPEDREDHSVYIEDVRSADLLAELEAGKVLCCSEYYGIPNVWKADDGSYRGTLLQYRNVTEAPTFESADDALEWFADTANAVAG